MAGLAELSVVGLRARASTLARQAEEIRRGLPRVIRRPLTVAVGLALLLAGVIMLVLPGPGLLAMGLGLAVLALEVRPARGLLLAIQARLERAAARRRRTR